MKTSSPLTPICYTISLQFGLDIVLLSHYLGPELDDCFQLAKTVTSLAAFWQLEGILGDFLLKTSGHPAG